MKIYPINAASVAVSIVSTGPTGLAAPTTPRRVSSSRLETCGDQAGNRILVQAQRPLQRRTWGQTGGIGCVTAFLLWIAACSPQPAVSLGHPPHERRMSLQPGKGEVPCGVWRVQGKRNVLYLAATQHKLSKDQIPFPSPFYAAYQDSEELSVEADVLSPRTNFLASAKARQWMRSHRADFNCPPGRCLGDYLTEETVLQVKKQFGNDYPKIEKYTPLALAYFFQKATVDSLVDSAIGGLEGVDEYFLAQAYKDQKSVRELDDAMDLFDRPFIERDEDIETTKALIEKYGPDLWLEATIAIDNKKQIPAAKNSSRGQVSEMSKMWRRGDLKVGERWLNDKKGQDPEGYEWMLVKRNHKWLPKIRKSLDSPRNQMVLVGAAHMPGKDGLVNLLRQEGYRVEQMYGIDRPAGGATAEPVRYNVADTK